MAAIKHKVLIVDDDAHVRKVLRLTLSASNYIVFEAPTGGAAISSVDSLNPDLLLLDLDLPDMTGLDVLRNIRRNFHKSVIIISVHNQVEDIVAALQSGADDFITKPFRAERVLSSISSLMTAGALKRRSIVAAGALSIDLNEHIVKNGDLTIDLTPDEQRILELLSAHNGRIFTESHLSRYMDVKPPEDSLFIKKLINSLRIKIEPNVNRPKFIISEPGVGYRFVA